MYTDADPGAPGPVVSLARRPGPIDLAGSQRATAGIVYSNLWQQPLFFLFTFQTSRSLLSFSRSLGRVSLSGPLGSANNSDEKGAVGLVCLLLVF